MQAIIRGIRNAFRNGLRTCSIVIIIGLTIALSLAMLVAHQAVGQRITDVQRSIGNTITISPAGVRGFEGGGPQAELLRRLAHWLMKEPELESENLSAAIVGDTIRITRRTMAKQTPAVNLTMPSGKVVNLPLTRSEPGLWTIGSLTEPDFDTPPAATCSGNRIDPGTQLIYPVAGVYAMTGKSNPGYVRVDVGPTSLSATVIASSGAGSIVRLRDGRVVAATGLQDPPGPACRWRAGADDDSTHRPLSQKSPSKEERAP